MSRVVKAPLFRAPLARTLASKAAGDEQEYAWGSILKPNHQFDEDECTVTNRDPEAFDQAAEWERMRREAAEHAKALGAHYQSSISTALAERLAGVEILDGQRARVSLRDGGQVTDEGPRMRAANGSDEEIGAMLEMAHAKKWNALEISGNDQFVWRTTIAALQDGRLKPDQIKPARPEQAHVIEDAKKRFAEGQALAARERAEAALRVSEPSVPSMRKWRDAEATPAASAAQRRPAPGVAA